MDRYAVFVDAGYFFAAGAQAAFGSNTPRKHVAIKSVDAMLADLLVKASAATESLPYLRTYWYDAMPGPRLSLEQSTLAMQRGVKLRLGVLNNVGEQKGVDSLIVTDLIDLARNHAIADAVLIAGDEDLRIGVQLAQSFGVRVHLLAVNDPAKNVSAALQMEADSVAILEADWFAKHLDLIQDTMQNENPASPLQAVELDDAANKVINEILDGIEPSLCEQLSRHFSANTNVPPEYDRPLVAKVSALLSGRRLTGNEMRHIRGLFVRAVNGA